MDMESWLRSKNMSTNEFAQIIGCARQIIWKAKVGRSIDTVFADKIYFATGGTVKVKATPKGRPKLRTIQTNTLSDISGYKNTNTEENDIPQ